MVADVYEDDGEDRQFPVHLRTAKCVVLSKSGTQDAKLPNIRTLCAAGHISKVVEHVIM